MSKAKVEEDRSLELRALQQIEHERRIAERNERKLQEIEELRRAREEQQEIARQKQKEFQLVKDIWKATQNEEKKTKKKKSKTEQSDDNYQDADNELYDSDSDDNAPRAAPLAELSDSEEISGKVNDVISRDEIFGSDSEEEEFVQPQSYSSKSSLKRVAPTALSESEDEIDFKDGASSDRTVSKPPPLKQRRVQDDEEEQED